ncbi:MAG: hypothetical protein LBH96_02330 [Candidatus Peribacteria bacterium]|nr:hypothetical protein [Candidatus Peribacteria bacterium]
MFFLADKGKRDYDNFISFPKELTYRLYAKDKNKNETYLDFSVQGKSTTTGATNGSGTTSTGNVLNGDAAALQSTLDTRKDSLLSSLNSAVNSMKKVYDDKVKALVETPLFKAVECLGFLSASAMDVDIATIKSTNEKAILEQYVEISANIKRFSVGLLTNEKELSDAIYNFNKDFSDSLVTLESNYETTYQKLKSDFDMYYSNNKDLVYELAEKIQKIDDVKASYQALLDAEKTLYDALDQKTSIRTALESPKKSVIALLKGDIDDKIKSYQTRNPEVSYEKMLTKRDELVATFDSEATVFMHKIFESDFDYSLYLSAIEKVDNFLEQYTINKAYQCGIIISSSLNWERTYLELVNQLDLLTKGMKIATSKVENWNSSQVKTIESTMLLLFKDYYTKNLSAKETAFASYVIQLISDAYYENMQQSPEEATQPSDIPQVSWTPYTFTKTYTKGSYALELIYLQQFLTAQGLYNGEIHGRYDAPTIEAVYKYQLQEGVISGKESNKSAYGWM